MAKQYQPKLQYTLKEIVGISYSDKRGIQSYIPKPVIEFLGEPTTLKLTLKNGKITITSGD